MEAAIATLCAGIDLVIYAQISRSHDNTKHKTQNILIFLLALTLRLFAIEQQSLWADEGGTIALASRSLEQIGLLHLVSADGTLIAQYDGPLTEISRAAILIPPGTMAGSYELLLGLYDPASGTRLELANLGGDSLLLDTLDVR